MVLPKSLLKFYPVVRALGHECVHSLNDAKRLAKTVLFLWQKSAYPELALRAPYGSTQFIDLERVKNFVRWLDSQPFNDAAYWLASAYANWVGNEVRTQQALYFTPPKLADRVIDDLISRGASLATHHWHDPACGGAAFLVPIARRMAAELTSKGFPAKAVLKHIETHISGNDLDDTLLEISEQFLLMALQDLSRQTSYTPHFKLGLFINFTGIFLLLRDNPVIQNFLLEHERYRTV
jgi:adenine-specific DNA-methyltransferase